MSASLTDPPRDRPQAPWVGRPVRGVMVVSGAEYLAAARLAARTYERFGLSVELWAPRGEGAPGVRQLSFALGSLPKRTAHLKVRAWAELTDGPTLFLDADTCCRRPLQLEAALDAVAHGRLAAAPDRADRHVRDPRDPWFVPGLLPRYVNSGVLLLGDRCRDLLEAMVQRLADPALHLGPYHDQRVLNGVLASQPSRLHLLPRSHNAIRWWLPSRAVIEHFAGGAGRLGASRRRQRHRRACERTLIGCPE